MLLSSSSFATEDDHPAMLDRLGGLIAARGHEVEVVRLPFAPDDAVHDQMLCYRLLHVVPNVDRLIAFRPPAHVVRHPAKIVWFMPYGPAGRWAPWRQDRRAASPEPASDPAIRRADRVGLDEARAVFAPSAFLRQDVSPLLANREVLAVPPLSPTQLRLQPRSDLIVGLCRGVPLARNLLVVNAMHYVATPVRLCLPDAADQRDALRRAAAGLPDGTVCFDSAASSETLATIYCAAARDDHGPPVLAAALGGLPSIVAADSGGVLEFVQDGQTGLVTAPTAPAIAAAMDRLWHDRALAARLGRAARARGAACHWEHVTTRLLA